MATYPYAVKYNGEYYESGEDVPEITDMMEDENSLPFSDNDIELEENSEEKKYTKSDIQRMNKAELQELARNSGVEGADEMTGQELKDYLLSMFNL